MRRSLGVITLCPDANTIRCYGKVQGVPMPEDQLAELARRAFSVHEPTDQVTTNSRMHYVQLTLTGHPVLRLLGARSWFDDADYFVNC